MNKPKPLVNLGSACSLFTCIDEFKRCYFFFFFSWVYFDPGTQFSKCLSQRHMLNEPQNWSVSLSPSNTSYTLSLGKGAGPSRNKHAAGIYVLSGGFIAQLRDPGVCLSIHQAVFCSGVTPHLHTEQASLLHPFLYLWCHLLLGMGFPVGDECCCCRTESLPCTELEKHLPGISHRNLLAPALPPSCAAFLAAPTPALCNCLRAGEVTPGACFDPVVSPLLSNAVWKDLFESFFSRTGRPCSLAHAHGAAALGFEGNWKPGLWLGTQSLHSALLLHFKRPVCAQRSDGCPSDIPACRDPATATPPAVLCLPCLVCWRLLEHLHMLNSHCVTPWQRVLFYPLLRGVNWDREHPMACLWPHKKFSGGPAIRTLWSTLCCVLMSFSSWHAAFASSVMFWPLCCISRPG